MDEIPRAYAVQLADAYTIKELRQFLHHAELERSVEMEHGDERLAGFWEWLARCYRAGIAHAIKVEQWRRMQMAKAHPERHQRRDIKDLVREVKERIDIVDYIGRYVTLKKSGNTYEGLCPFHPDRNTPSFKVWPAIQAFRCFGCGARGDVLSFRRLLEERNLI